MIRLNRETLGAWMKQKEIRSLKGLADKVGISDGFMYDLWNGNAEPGCKSILALIRSTGKAFGDVFIVSGEPEQLITIGEFMNRLVASYEQTLKIAYDMDLWVKGVALKINHPELNGGARIDWNKYIAMKQAD